jgi:hypothetical protein
VLDADLDFGLELLAELGGFLIDAVADASFHAVKDASFSDGLTFLALKDRKTLPKPQAPVEDEGSSSWARWPLTYLSHIFHNPVYEELRDPHVYRSSARSASPLA